MHYQRRSCKLSKKMEKIPNKNLITLNENVNKCEICEKIFSKKEALKKHLIAFHNQKETLFNCNICSKSLQTYPILLRHIKTVHGQKNFKSKSCGKSFSSAGYLKKHIYTVHEGHKDHKCETCGKSFTGAQYLKNTSIQFIKATKITNVILVTNHFLKHKI